MDQGHPRCSRAPLIRTVNCVNDTVPPNDLPPTEELPPPPPPPGDLPPAAASPRIIGGVCALLGDRLGVDPLWLRIGFVLLALAGGLGLFVYGALWLALVHGPAKGSSAITVIGGAILLVGVPLTLNDGWIDGPLAVMAVLAAVAVALWQAPTEQRQPVPPPPRSARPWAGEPPPPAWDAPTATPPPADRPRRPSSPLGALTLGLALVVAAAGALIDEANGGRLHPEQWLGAAAVMCGLGLLVGTVRGHARWLIVPALVIAGAGVAAGDMARLGIGGSDLVGDRWINIYSDSSGDITERLGIGSISINVDDVPASQIRIDARVAIGEISIAVADHVAVDVIRGNSTPSPLPSSGPAGGVERIGRPDGPADVTIDARVAIGRVNRSTMSLGGPHPNEDIFGEIDESRLDEGLGQLTEVHDGVSMTDDGWIVLGHGEVVIDDQDRVVVGDATDEINGVESFSTSYGDYRLLPRGLLITPYEEVLDLQALRAEFVTSTTSPGELDHQPDPDVTVPSEGAQP